MVEILSTLLPIIIYILLIILLIVVIVLGIKTITMIDLMNSVIEDVEAKLASINRLFNICGDACRKLTSVTDFVQNVVNKIMRRKEED